MNPHLIRELPVSLRPLADIVGNLAFDLRWTWSHMGDAFWEKIDSETWARTKNPYVVIQNLSSERFAELANDKKFHAEVERLATLHEQYLKGSGWYGENRADCGLQGAAYFSMEFGLGEALPLYAGGLGILAGDYLKAASDLGVPLIGIGLLYQQGYFRQTFDALGRQQATYAYNDPIALPVQPVRAPNGTWLHVECEFPGRSVRLRAWRAQVGRLSLYLLDSNDPLNGPVDRGITANLYGGVHEMRLAQEIALGIGGWRLIEALGLKIDVCHLNEGHAAFAALERARCYMSKAKVDFWQALWATRAGNVFTTHTPVAAGFDTFAPELLLRYGQRYAEKLGVTPQELGALGRKSPHDSYEPFNMAYLAARTCATINGVSKLHGEVSRRIFQDLYPRWPRHEVPITHVTNGVHVPTWDSPWADKVWTEVAGKERWRGGAQGLTQAILENVDDDALWAFSCRERADLVVYARQRFARQLSDSGADASIIDEAKHVLDPNTLTLGFARRFAEYKRPNMLIHDPDRLVRLLTSTERPVQIIVAGKAHPDDPYGKQAIAQWLQFIRRPEVRMHVVFLADYSIALAQQLVQGVDLWINTPRRPWEACGTSGMKVLVNGGLNLSELDGWWAEAYAPDVGWALGDGREHAEPEWDAVEAGQLYRLLEEEIVPMFYARDERGIPRAWVSRIRASVAKLAPQFSTNRMLREYIDNIYVPAARQFAERTADAGRIARELRHWDGTLCGQWHQVRCDNAVVHPTPNEWRFQVQVHLGEIEPDAVQVQLYADPTDDGLPTCQLMQREHAIPGSSNGYIYIGRVAKTRPHTHFTPRVVAYHVGARTPAENNLIVWCAAAAILADDASEG